jgi:predicted histone-like DNA-binding protein
MRFKKSKRKITTGSSPGDKFVPQLDRGVKVNTEQLAEMMVTSSTVSKGDMLNTIDSLITQMFYVLQLGHSVKLRGFGTFYVKTKVKAVDTLEEVTADTVERITIGFLPDVEIRDRMKKISITIEASEEEEEVVPNP